MTIDRPTLLATIATASLLAAGLAQAQTAPRAVHDRALVVDAHVDQPLPYDPPPAGFDPFADGQASAAKLRAGGVDAIFASVFVGQGPRTPEGYAAARRQADAELASILSGVERHKDRLALARSTEDVRRIAASGKTAVVLSLLNAYAFGEDVGALERFQRRGVRVVGLTHAGHNAFADSSRPRAGEPAAEHGGLSPLGRRAIAASNRLGVLVDVSQLTKPGLLEAVRISTAPVIASHSGVRALIDNSRNLDDEELDAVAGKGGVVAITPFSAYLRPKPAGYDEGTKALAERFGTNRPGPNPDQRAAYAAAVKARYGQASLEQYLAAIDHAVKRVGVDHVGFGSDFNHGGGVRGFDDASQAPNLTAALLKRGYSEADVAKLLGGNVLRVLAEAERQAAIEQAASVPAP